jgi:ribosomal protein S18 acetylase RimI-like enzyme
MMGIWQSDEDKENITANVFGVFVVSEYRGRGISKQLMQALLDELKTNPKIAKLKLVVNKNQSAAVKLYEGFGFEIKSQEKSQRGYDEYLMEKDL